MPEGADLRRYAQIGLAILAVVAAAGSGYAWLNRGGGILGPHVIASPASGPVGTRPLIELVNYPGDQEYTVYFCVGATSEIGDCTELVKGKAGTRLRAGAIPATLPDSSDVTPSTYTLRVGPENGSYPSRGRFRVERFTVGDRVTFTSYRGVDPSRLSFGEPSRIARGAPCVPPGFLSDGRLGLANTVLDTESGASVEFAFQAAESAWSPAGDKMAYITSDNKSIRLAPPDGTDAVEKVREARGLLSSLTWSPSGDRLAYISQNDPSTRLGPGPPTVRILNATNGQITSAGPGLSVAWSPRAEVLAVERAGGVIEASDPLGARRPLASGRKPAWSPDGSFLTVIRDVAGGEQAFVVSTSDSSKAVAVSDPGTCAASFSATGAQVALVAGGDRTVTVRKVTERN